MQKSKGRMQKSQPGSDQVEFNHLLSVLTLAFSLLHSHFLLLHLASGRQLRRRMYCCQLILDVGINLPIDELGGYAHSILDCIRVR